MSGTTVRVKFAKARTKRPKAAQGAPDPVQASGPTRLARMLALAHYIERLVEAGELSGYAEAAKALGLTRARVTQVMDLLYLAPDIQEEILALADAAASCPKHRSLLPIAATAAWSEQRRLWRAARRA